jgi:single-strand DNA-binding protein
MLQKDNSTTPARNQAAPADSTYRDKNEVHLCGVLARDPEVRHTPTGKTVANLSLLTVNKQYKSYHSLVAWEQLAEKVAPLKKGQRVKVVGALQTRSWERDGQKHYRTDVICWQIVIQGKEGAFKNAHGLEVSDADIPF